MSIENPSRRMPTSLKKGVARRDFLKGLTSLGALAFLSWVAAACSQSGGRKTESTAEVVLSRLALGDAVSLPEPRKKGTYSLEEALYKRRSIRTYSGEPLTLEEVSQLVWAAQGVTNSKGYRTAPSAVMSYPLQTYLIIGDVENLEKNVYRYQPSGHRLVKTLEGDYRSQLASAYLGPYYVTGGALYFLFTASIRASGDWAKYAHMEVGHAAQNVYLQAAAMGLGTVVNGGFDADRARGILNLPDSETPLYFMPVGRLVSS